MRLPAIALTLFVATAAFADEGAPRAPSEKDRPPGDTDPAQKQPTERAKEEPTPKDAPEKKASDPDSAKPGAPKAKAPTYYEDVASIVQRRCETCHRSGAIGPMALTTYKEVAGWSAMIQEVVSNGRMPPWHADEKVGHWANSRRLPAWEKKTLLDWIDAGAPKGDPKAAPAKASYPDPKAWRIGKPDLILKTPEPFTVPATGTVPYQYWNVPTKLDSDKWIKAIEVKVGAATVVHHVLIFVLYPNRRDSPRVRGGLQGYFASALPGDSIAPFPEGSAKFLPKGATLIFQVHYTPDGTKRKDQSSIGLKFADPKDPIIRRARTLALHQTRFAIPPGAKDHTVRATYTFRRDSILFGLTPHMHLRGKSFRYLLRLPDGKAEPLLSVSKYDFNWQNTYRLLKPRFIPKGSKVIGVAGFDNSKDNPANPDPTKTVRFGEQTWDEMMIGYLDVLDATSEDRAAWEKTKAAKAKDAQK